MVIVLIGISASVLLLTGESRIQDENPGYGVDQDTKNAASNLSKTTSVKNTPFLSTDHNPRFIVLEFSRGPTRQ